MSCEIRVSACIQEIPAIRRCLFPTDDQRGGENWLQLCKVSASPTGDMIVIGNDRRLVVLTAKWESSSSTNQYQISFADSIHDYDRIKSILCLPIVGQSQSSHVGPDWTCILLGFDSGFIRFYTENCELLMEEQFHCENINSIKCQSQHSPRPDISPELHPEEIYVQYQSNVCVINGAHLFPNLRNCRSQLARIQSKAKPLDLHPQPLAIKKWGFQDQSVINDVAVVGLNLSSTFDHLMTASTCGGYKTKYRSTAPNSTLVLAAGSKPYLGYHYVLEGANQPILSDVAKAVASRLKSALPGWLTGSKAESEKEVSVAHQSMDMMGCRFGLCDLQRTANEIVLTPNRRLAAVTDALGRVILVDSFRGVALKIFKGYRDAQCAFVQVPDERRSKHKPGDKVGHFLVIYAPKKGVLEIFTVQNGTKVATFSASRHSKLLYITHGLMGFTTTSKSRYVCQFTCIFIDNDGQIKEISVPFHFALAEKNSKRARDIHLYKKLRQLVKSEDLTPERLQNETCNVCSELKTLEIKKQTLEMLSSSKEVTAEVLLNCAEYFLQNQETDQEEECAKFIAYCQNLKSLLDLYIFVTNNENEDNQNENNFEEESKSFESLKLEGVELGKLQKLLDLSTVNDHTKLSKVKFSDEVEFTLSDFLASFDLTTPKSIELKSQLDESVVSKTGETLFKRCISGELNKLSELQALVTSSFVSIEHLFNLLISYWVNRDLDINLNLENDMGNFLKVVSTLVKCVKSDILETDYNLTSTFWGNIREYLSCSAKSFPALMAAMLCKSVAHQLELEKSDVENIEVLSQENIHWSLLIGKLEDISMINIILDNKPTTKNATLPCLKFDKKDISLKYILEQGRGSVTELVAQWLTSSGIDPENIHINEIIYKNQHNNDTNGENNKLEITEGMYLDKIEIVKVEPIFKHLNLLKTQFPYSLDSSALLANMCWEYALAWRENISDLSKLEAARECLLWVTDWAIQQGLHLLLWNTHLKIVVESTSKLINKVGKLPKEKLCLQDTGLTDKQISQFVGICEDFFHSFLNVTQTPSEQPNLQYEALWENAGNQSLVELACQHKDVDYNLLELHYLLVLTLQMITAFSVKHSKPLNNLFEASMVNLFFTDLQKNVDINWNKNDIKLISSRTQFLYKIISASLETVTINEDGKMYCEKHVDWMAKCLTLARGWNLDVEALKRYQILQLYINGFDTIAEELVPAVNETNELGVELLAVTGKRLSQFLTSSEDLGKNITALSPVLSRYLETLDIDWCSPSSLPVIKSLALVSLRCISEDHKDFKLAELILDACLNLQEINT